MTLFRDSTDSDKARLADVRALDRMYQGRALPRRRDRWLRTVAYWAGCAYHLLALPFREGPGLGFFWLLFCVVELWVILHMAAG